MSRLEESASQIGGLEREKSQLLETISHRRRVRETRLAGPFSADSTSGGLRAGVDWCLGKEGTIERVVESLRGLVLECVRNSSQVQIGHWQRYL